MSYRAGFLGLIGQPNAGKSTLMNYLVEAKISIVSAKPQTTRRRMLGIWSSKEGQIVFVDAPGLIKAEQGLNGFLAREAEEVVRDSDALLAVLAVDAARAEEAEQTLALVKASGKPWLAIITKTDLAEKAHRAGILKNLVEAAGGRALTLSALKKDRDSGEEHRAVIDACLALLPEAPAPLYDAELFTPESEKSLAVEIVREKCFEFLHQEVPFGIAVQPLLFDEAADPVPRLAFDIIVSKENHKGMVIGRGGEMLKKIGTAARKDIEKMLGEKIFLELKVTVRENWARQAKFMKELGYVHDSKN